MRGRALGTVVFLAGTGSLATEIAASRLLAPAFGSSTVVWANLIGVVLAALAVGYWLGGKLADRRPEPLLLGRLVLLAALLVAATPFVSRPLLEIAVRAVDEAQAGAVVASFAAVVFLFAPPVVLLGAVSPFAIRLAVDDLATAGAVAGRLYALSTAGSLVGTFIPALVAIPLLGTQRTLLGSAALLALASALLLGRRALVVVVGLAALAALLPVGAIRAADGVIHESESRYQFIQVVERSDGSRVLYLNEGIAAHSIWRQGTVLTGGAWDMFLTVPSLLGRPLERVAILGNAGGTTARALARFHPRAVVDGVEIDPEVSRIGRRYFGLGESPNVRLHDEDARPFLRATDERYDMIAVDAYRQPYVPFHLATREFFRLAREHLRPGGIVALNVARVPGDDRLVEGIAGTLAAEFPQVVVWPALRFNVLVLGFGRPVARSEISRRLRRGPAELEPLRRLLEQALYPVAAADRPWTDDRAPVEWATDRMIAAFATRGGSLDETFLPTAP